MKQQIMEVLLSGDNNLTKEQIQWAIHNIPETGETMTFDHSQDDVWRACGLSKEQNSEIIQEYMKIKEDVQGDKKSQLIEDFMTKASPKLVRSFIIRAVCEYEDELRNEMMKKLQSIIDKLK